MFFNLSKLLVWKRLLVTGYEKRRLWTGITFCNFIFILTAFVIIIFHIPDSLLLGISSMSEMDTVTEVIMRNE